MFTVHQHWDPLKVCAVGRSYPPEFYKRIKDPKVRSVMEKIAIETEEDYQKLIAKLEEFKVKVLRTDISDLFEDHIRTDTELMFPPPMYPRDHTAMIGDTFFMPGKKYGNFNLDVLLEKYGVKEKFYSIRNPLLNSTIIEEVIQAETQTIGSNIKYPNNKKVNSFQTIEKFLIDTNTKICYDTYINSACTIRVGKDLYFSVVNDINKININKFYSKLKNLFPNYKLNIVDVPGHSDGALCPVKPGLLVCIRSINNYKNTFPGWEYVNVEGESWDKMKPFLDLKEKNKGKWWIPGEEYNNDLIDYIETWLKDWVTYVEETVFDVNMLIIDEHNVICNGYNKDVFDAFERYNITPHIVNFRHRYFWDGGLHCITSDISREGTQKDYFPNRKGSQFITTTQIKDLN
jgi:hypothetical protein